MRVAVVGGGVSGLVAARHLHDAGHKATLFEAADYPGGHTNTIRVETERGAWNVDTGFIVFNDRNYPNFERLLDRLGVAAQPADMSFSVADQAGRFEWASRPAGLFANPAHLVDRRFHRMLLDLLRFNRQARALIGTNGSGPSLRRFLADGGYSDYFIERLIVPQVSAVWSADPDQLWSFPASFLAEFFDNHGILALTGRPRWRTIVGGSQTYVDGDHRSDARQHPAANAGAPHRAPSRSGRDRLGRWIAGLRRGRDRDPRRPGAGDAGRPLAGRARDPRAPSPISATRPSCTRTSACFLAAGGPGRAGTSTWWTSPPA